ncbi:hypothetical protein B0H16DRAFT_1474783 [Mycena metata]|uniref:Uncharacterized protein n=1 Tax=Mycena metata TaxID=1033252 RepID=A0AAD7HFJ1_9AGAR|nr:hypothetical protein B0H16DRAFT_1474783 [Mycena metata]
MSQRPSPVGGSNIISLVWKEVLRVNDRRQARQGALDTEYELGKVGAATGAAVYRQLREFGMTSTQVLAVIQKITVIEYDTRTVRISVDTNPTLVSPRQTLQQIYARTSHAINYRLTRHVAETFYSHGNIRVARVRRAVPKHTGPAGGNGVVQKSENPLSSELRSTTPSGTLGAAKSVVGGGNFCRGAARGAVVGAAGGVSGAATGGRHPHCGGGNWDGNLWGAAMFLRDRGGNLSHGASMGRQRQAGLNRCLAFRSTCSGPLIYPEMVFARSSGVDGLNAMWDSVDPGATAGAKEGGGSTTGFDYMRWGDRFNTKHTIFDKRSFSTVVPGVPVWQEFLSHPFRSNTKAR